MTNQKIKDKIQKLLNLSNSSNPNEAMSAMVKARELMAKYKLTEMDVTGEVKEVVITKKINGITFTTRTNAWLPALANIITANYCCKALRNRLTNQTGEIMIAGFTNDVEVCKTVLEYAIDCVTNNNHIIEVVGKRKSLTKKQLDNFKYSFAYGFVAGLSKKFEEQNETHKEYSLVLSTPEAVKEALKDCIARSFDNSRTTEHLNTNIYNKGYEEGYNFSAKDKLTGKEQ